MSQAIHCPGCNKKYSLPENPPATFTCRQCGTLMDLSDFGGQDRPPKPARQEAGGPPRSRRQRAKGGGGGGRGAPAPSRGSGRSSRAAAGPSRAGGSRGGRRGRRDDEYDDGGRRGARARKENNNAAMIGAIVALVVVVALAIIILGGKDDEPVDGGGTDSAKAPKGDAPTALTGLSSDPASGAGQPAGAAPAASAPTGDAPKAAAPKGTPPKAAPPKAEPKSDGGASKSPPVRNRDIRSMKLEIHEWPDEVDAETRTQVEEAIAAVHAGGRDGIEAKDFLISKGRPVAGRIISEFKKISESPGFDNRDGASQAGMFDAILRKIDGWQERRFREQNQIRHMSREKFIMQIAQRWTAWWTSGEWKRNPRKPWDPFEDSWDDVDGSKKKKKGKGQGFGKRAGG